MATRRPGPLRVHSRLIVDFDQHMLAPAGHHHKMFICWNWKDASPSPTYLSLGQKLQKRAASTTIVPT